MMPISLSDRLPRHSRRSLLRGISATLLASVVGGRARAQAAGAPVFWVQICATGGWDQMLFCDPKFGPRADQDGGFHDLTQLQQAGNIPFVDAFALSTPGIRPVAPFMNAQASRLTVWNGLDFATNNHDVGVRHGMSGALLEGFPIFAAQVAGVMGRGQVMPLVDVSGYDEAGGLTAPVRLDYIGVPTIARLQDVNVPSPGQYLNDRSTVEIERLALPSVHDRIRASALARIRRQKQKLRLPQQRAGLTALEDAVTATPGVRDLQLPEVAFSDIDNAKALATMGIRAFKDGLASAMNVSMGGPNLDSHGIADYDHLAELSDVFELATHIVDVGDAEGVAVGVVMTSDFGRTPVREGAGSGHWPVGSMMLLQNDFALALGLVPANLVVGGTTGAPDGGDDIGSVLQARRVNPGSLAFDDTGVLLTPGHVYRVLRRAAGIDGAAELRSFPINVEGGDLDL